MCHPFSAFPHQPAKGRRGGFWSAFAPPGKSSAAGLLSLSLALAGLSSCASTPSKPDSKVENEGQELFGGPAKDSSAGEVPANGWSIVIVAFRGDGQDELAAAGLAKARSVAGLREAYTERQGNATVIAYGRYPSPDAPEAQADLERIQQLEIDGGRPFDGAVLAPPMGTGTGRMPELDLLNVRRTFGNDAIYTLQVASYARDDRRPPQSAEERAEFVRMAEDAAAQLRREGQQAFYYHGPNESLVTVGVFGPDDFDPTRPEARSSRLRAAQDANPIFYLNGKGVRARVPGVPESSPRAWRMRKSQLVAIPDSE
jgi:hypothetical protein